MTIVVLLASALLCISDQCYPALVGKDTPIGTFPLIRRYILTKGYGGDVLQFSSTESGILAIHRVWLGRPEEHRAERLATGNSERRRFVTNGCINVVPDVYDMLQTAQTLEVRP